MQQLTEEPLRVLSRGQHMKGSAVGAASARVQDGPKHGDLEEEMGSHRWSWDREEGALGSGRLREWSLCRTPCLLGYEGKGWEEPGVPPFAGPRAEHVQGSHQDTPRRFYRVVSHTEHAWHGAHLDGAGMSLQSQNQSPGNRPARCSSFRGQRRMKRPRS